MDRKIDAIYTVLERHGLAVTEGLRADVEALLPTERSSRTVEAATWHGSDDPDVLEDTHTAGDLELPSRYTAEGLLGRGGMGRVLKVRDDVLGRSVAMKVARRDLSQAARSRFVAEAQATSQLEHPGIVPVYDLGTLPSSEPYYTMPLIRGQTLSKLIHEVHACSGPDGWEATESGVTLHRVIAHFHAVCDALAYAHARGVVHRDLKPDNIMIGDFGVTLVVDWGLARVLGRPDAFAAVHTTRTHRETAGTLDGTVVGTPGYLAPEQARGDREGIDARADVHALGATLYEILAGKRPFGAESRFDALAGVLHDPAPPIRGAPGPVPEELAQLAMACLHKSPDDRPDDASVLARVVGDWLDGARRRERARAELAEADRLDLEIEDLRGQARSLDTRALDASHGLRPWDADTAKRAVWRLQDQAEAGRRRADLLEAQRVQALQASLRFVPELVEAHARLADHYQRQHARAEREGRWGDAAALELTLRTHDRGQHAAYLTGQGAVTVVTEPPGAEVTVFRYELQDRRLVAVPFGRLGATPVLAAELPMGSYRLVLAHPDCVPVRYPVQVGRGAHWTGVAPGQTEPRPVRLPRLGDVEEDHAYVPAGWFAAGGDPSAFFPRPRTDVWLDGFVLRRFPVTNAEFVGFLNTLIDDGREAEALEWAPRDKGPGPPIWRRVGDHFVLGHDLDGDEWLPDNPVVNVSWDAARAYAAHEAQRTGQPWRLPWEAEWEKAARGVDGRIYPWGDFADPSWLVVRDHTEVPALASVHACPADVGPYGTRGMAGNVIDWCLDVFEPTQMPLPSQVDPGSPETQRALRGGEWFGGLRAARAASRATSVQRNREAVIGFRLARSLG